MKKLSIIIPVWNNFNFTKKCLEDLDPLSKEDHEIIVIDNGSTDQTRKLKSKDNVRVLRNGRNEGFGKACNQAYGLSEGECVMFLNNDIRVRSDKDSWTHRIIDACDEKSLVGPTVGVLDNDFNFITEASKMPERGLVYMSGWNLTAKNNVWQSLTLEGEDGPFNSNNFFAYFEDTDLSFRAKKAGYDFKIIDVPVHHFGRMTGKKLNLAETFLKSKAKFNEIWSYKKNQKS